MRANRIQRVISFVQARPYQDIPAVEFEPIGGRQGWRTAISEARRQVQQQGGDIKWVPRYVKGRDGHVITLSYYRYLPGEPVQLPLKESA